MLNTQHKISKEEFLKNIAQHKSSKEELLKNMEYNIECNKNMLNIGVVCDTSWDNYILIENKFKKINIETFKVNTLYGKTLEIFNNCANKNTLSLIRHYSDNLSNTLYNMLKICELWLIFTNNIEYLTSPSLIITKCEEYNIKFIIISEYNRNNDYYSFEHDTSLSFKKILKKIEKKDKLYDITKFNLNDYNENFITRQLVPICISPSIRNKLRSMHEQAEEDKRNKSIKLLLYDKAEIKRVKQQRKTEREANQLQFMNNRLSYYKTKST